MTRAEKFKEVFGLEVDVTMDCGFFDCNHVKSCKECPVKKYEDKESGNIAKYWMDEYKEEK